MISKISGPVVAQKENSVLIEIHGFSYEVLVPYSVQQRIGEQRDQDGRVTLIIYHYIQLGPSSAVPVLVGFLSEVERDFFLHFIKVSGIGPRAALRALNKPISEISRAIDQGDDAFLKTLPGIGAQKAKEIIAKLQGKVGKYGLIRDRGASPVPSQLSTLSDWQQEAMDVLLQLQYTKAEAKEMIQQALRRSQKQLTTAEELLNEIYKQRI